MQPSITRDPSFRRALPALLALAVSILCGIGIASAASANKRAQPAAVHPLGLVAPLAARRHAAAHAQHAALGVRRPVKLIGRTLKARLMASTLQNPIVTVGSQPTGVAVSQTRAYVANQGSNTLSVIDLSQNPPTVVATLPVGSAPDAAALSANGARLDVPNFNGGSVSVIDTASNTVTKTVSMGAGSRPAGVLELAGLVYVANLGAHTIAVFDPSLASPTVTSFTVPASGASPSAPSGLAASP